MANPQGRLLERATGQAPAKRQTLADQINGMLGEVQKVLPKITTPERLARVTLTTIRTNPKLAGCSVPSLLGAMLNCAQLGLEPGPGDYVYLVPRYSKATGQDECVWTLGYKGILELARRNGVDVISRTVHDGDEFALWTDEHGDHVAHRPALRDRGEAIGYYAVARGEALQSPIVHYMPREEIERHRAASDAGQSKFGPWTNWFDSMARKTVVRQMAPYLPLSVEMRQALAQDDGVRTDLSDEGLEVQARHEIEPAEEASPPTIPPPALPSPDDGDPGDVNGADGTEAPHDEPEAGVAAAPDSEGSAASPVEEPGVVATPTAAAPALPLPEEPMMPLEKWTIPMCREWLRSRHLPIPTPTTLPNLRQAVADASRAEDPFA